jgi:hypothetical protein
MSILRPPKINAADSQCQASRIEVQAKPETIRSTMLEDPLPPKLSEIIGVSRELGRQKSCALRASVLSTGQSGLSIAVLGDT